MNLDSQQDTGGYDIYLKKGSNESSARKVKFWQHHVVGPLQTNCFVLSNTMTEAILIDPGGPEVKGIASDLEKQGIRITHVLVTHGHFDHLAWASEIQKVIEEAKVYLHHDEKDSYEKFYDMMHFFGLNKIDHLSEPDVWIKDNQILNLSGLKIKVIHVPGHSPGSVIYMLEEEKDAYVGDCIFRNSIGRVDLPFSSPKKMIQSLKKVTSEITDEYRLLPGHGLETNMKAEKKHNPYLIALRRGMLDQLLL